MRRVVVIQARMTSTRLPGKVLADVSGVPMLAQLVRRLRDCKCVDDFVVATTTNATDDGVVACARREDIPWFRGSEQDVLGRFVGAAQQAKADVVIRVTADCPLIDAGVTDAVVKELTDHASECDYSSNVVDRTYPRGLDVEALFFDVLLRMDRMAQADADREHVTLLARSSRPELFLLRSLRDAVDNSDLRWTVDTPDDLQLVRALYEDLDLGCRTLPYDRILSYVRSNPWLIEMNATSTTWSANCEHLH